MNLTPDLLKTDLKKLSSDIVRELYLAYQKLLAYSLSHPARQQVIDPVFLLLRKWLRFKFFYQIEIDKDSLLTEQMVLDKDNFASNFASLMRKCEVERIRFYDWITPEDLLGFLVDLSVSERNPSTDLRKKNITSIEICYFDQRQRHLKRDIPINSKDVYSVEGLAENELKANPSTVMNIILGKFGTEKSKSNFKEEVLQMIADKVFVNLSPEIICQLTESELTAPNLPFAYKKLLQKITVHPQGKRLMFNLEKAFEKSNLPEKVYFSYFENCGMVLSHRIFEKACSDETAGSFEEDFLLLLSNALESGNDKPSKIILENIVKQLIQDDVLIRRRALGLIKSALDLLADNRIALGQLIGLLIESWDEQKQTFEILEALWVLAEKSLARGFYQDFGFVLNFLKKKVEEEKLNYRKAVLEEVLSKLAGSKSVNILIGNMNKAENGKLFEIAECLKLINTVEVAERLSRMINHPQSAKRIISLKILVQMGEQGMEYIYKALFDEGLILNPKQKNLNQLAKTRILEIINILKYAKSEKGLELLEELCEIGNTEIKLKIASELRQFDSRRAVGLLKRLAVDTEAEVRREAIKSLKLKVCAEDMEWLKAIYFEDNYNLKQLAVIIAGLECKEADKFLCEILTQDKRLEKDLMVKIHILEVLSKKGRIVPQGKMLNLKYEMASKPHFGLRKLILKKKVEEIVEQLAK